MKKRFKTMLALIGIISTSNYAGTFDVIADNAIPQKPVIHVESFNNLSIYEQDIVKNLFKEFVNADEIRKKELYKELLLMGDIFEFASSRPCLLTSKDD